MTTEKDAKDGGTGRGKKEQSVRKLVKRAERDPWNRLLSIVKDAEWVARFHRQELGGSWPVMPNLRCGAWYVPNALPAQSDSATLASYRGCYFKSTDGHTHQWAFSLKRYNLDLLQLLQQRAGCIIVDSTRRGKSMPDALSKTIPIWCAVINTAVQRRYATFAKEGLAWTQLHTPQHIVSASEHAQMDEQISSWTDDLLASDLVVPLLTRPLYPIFITRAHRDEALSLIEATSNRKDLPFHPLVLISASEMVPTPAIEAKLGHLCAQAIQESLELPPDVASSLEGAAFVYVQGSGDDEEAWAHGLSPVSFWSTDTLRSVLATKGDEALLGSCISQAGIQAGMATMRLETSDGSGRCEKVASTSTSDTRTGTLPIWLGYRPSDYVWSTQERKKYRLILHLDARDDEQADSVMKCSESGRIYKASIEHGKRGLNAFRASIAPCISLAQAILPGTILICSAEDGIGGDLCTGMAVAILSACFDRDKLLRDKPGPPSGSDATPLRMPLLTKDDVRRRLQWITSDIPHVKAPSRAHMLRINEALLSEARYRNASSSSST